MSGTDDLIDRLHRELDELKATRDDLRVRLHLGRAEVREQWDKLEKRWEHAQARLKVLREEARDSAEDVGEAARLLVHEIREGLDHLRRLV